MQQPGAEALRSQGGPLSQACKAWATKLDSPHSVIQDSCLLVPLSTRLLAFRCRFSFHDIRRMRLLDRLVGAGWINRTTAGRQLVGQLAQIFLPVGRRRLRRTHLRELAQQQDQAQQMAEDDALLLHQVAVADVHIEITGVAQQLTRRPHRLR